MNPLDGVATDHMRWIAEDPRPVIKINPHEAGLTVAGGRLTGTDNIYWRIAQFLMPVHAYAPSSMPGENIFGQSFIPVTDTSCWIYTYAWNPERPLTQAERDGYDRGNGVMSEVDENYVPLRNKANDYLIDRKLQKTNSYTGIKGVSEQDAAVQDSQGPIADRTREHLGPTDLGIMHFRKLVMDAARALQKGEAPPHLKHQDRYAVRSGACVTSKAKDLTAVMIERFGDAAGYVGSRAGTRRRSRDRRVVIARSDAPCVSRCSADDSLRRDDETFTAESSDIPGCQARFLQIEIALDPPPRLVGDLAVAQQDVDEFPLGRNQFPRQLRCPSPKRRALSGSSESGSWLARISCRARNSLTTSSDSSRSSVMASSDLSAASSASRRAAISASCSATMFVAAVLGDVRAIAPPAAIPSPVRPA